MIAFIVRRMLYMIPVLLGVLAITMTLFFVVADDPVLQYAGQNPSEAQLRALRAEFELDVPVFYSPSWLAGEDILESKRRMRVEAMMQRVDDAFETWLQDQVERARDDAALLSGVSGATDEERLANYRLKLSERLDAFKKSWGRDTVLAGRADAFNEDLRALLPGTTLSVSFEGIELTEAEAARVEARSPWDSQFFRVIRLDFADSMQYEASIWTLVVEKAPRTLAVTIPMFLVGLAIELVLSLFAASRRGQPVDVGITVLAVLAMSIPFLSYIILGQWLAAETGIVPVSGWAPLPEGIRYLIFPVAIGVVAGLGSAVRFYRAVLLEEMDRDYVRTARAKGVRRGDVLFIHVLRNAGIPIVTRLSVIVPFLITGSLLIETTFEIPGLGDMMLQAIRSRDFWVVMPLTYLLAVVYSVVVLLTDVVYAFVDPRVRVGS